MASREDILRKMNTSDNPVSVPVPWKSRRSFGELASQFAGALEAASGEVHWVENWKLAVDQMKRVLQEAGVQRVVVNNENPINRLDPRTQFSGIEWDSPGNNDWREVCANAHAGVTAADAALAETGSVVITSGAGKSRLVSLLPPLHVVLIPTASLVSDLFTWLEQRPGKLPAQLVLISGPSKTADIEQTLVVGVHGPKRLVVILYEDSAFGEVS